MMKFLKSFFLTLGELFHSRAAPLRREVGNNENLSRFIFSKSHFSTTNARIKRNAFMPYLGEVSVFRIDRLSEAQIWTIGYSIVGGDRTPKARAEIKAAAARISNLEVVPAEPPPRHANLVGWPPEKSKQMLIAAELAAVASLKLKDNF